MTKIKFAHFADAHLGTWRKDTLKQLVYNSFNTMVDMIIEAAVDFVLISGDLYDTSDPPVEAVDIATKGLKKFLDHGIPVYGIMGSHDFSESNKSMIRPLVSAGLFTNVSTAELTDDDKIQLHFSVDPKTGMKITGMRARKRGNEIHDYKRLDRDVLETEPGNKIFLLHTPLTEFKDATRGDDELIPRAFLPPGFVYYAGGHLHKTIPESLRQGE
nr:DNA repair exonuclease [Candidatus Sigynarchaeota archaeon]